MRHIDKVSRLAGAVHGNRPGQHAGLIGHQQTGNTAQAGQGDDQAATVAGLQFKQGLRIHQAIQHLAHIVGLVHLWRDDVHQVVDAARAGAIRVRQHRQGIAGPAWQQGQEITGHVHGFRFGSGVIVRDPALGCVHAGAAQRLRRGFNTQ